MLSQYKIPGMTNRFRLVSLSRISISWQQSSSPRLTLFSFCAVLNFLTTRRFVSSPVLVF